MALADPLEVGANAGQGFHTAPELPDIAGLLLIGEGGQESEAAVLAAEIPILAGAQVIQKALVPAVKDDAHVGDAGVDHAAEDKVDNAVAPGKGDGSGHTVGGQLP